MTRMTASEAFVETLVAQGVTDVFGIVGSAYMDALDIFPAAGIRFIPTVHEQGSAHMADGYSRVSGRHGVCIGQNGPRITNIVTARSRHSRGAGGVLFGGAPASLGRVPSWSRSLLSLRPSPCSSAPMPAVSAASARA